MIPKPDHVKCVLKGLAHEPERTWCGGEKSSAEWTFKDATHALQNGEKEGIFLVCPACAEALASALAKAVGEQPKAKGFLTMDSIMAVVRGQLKSTINDHGPVTLNFIGSAARRVAGGVIGHLRQSSLRDTSNAAAKLEVKRLSQEIKELQTKVHKKGDQIRYFVDKLQALGIPLGIEEGDEPCSQPEK